MLPLSLSDSDFAYAILAEFSRSMNVVPKLSLNFRQK